MDNLFSFTGTVFYHYIRMFYQMNMERKQNFKKPYFKSQGVRFTNVLHSKTHKNEFLLTKKFGHFILGYNLLFF